METGKTITFSQIGIIHSPFKEHEGTPIQSVAANGVEGTVEVFREYVEGLQDLSGFSHIILLYYFHRTGKPSLKVRPFMDDQVHGVFSTRAPNRPNQIGLSVVKLLKLEEHMLYIEDVDILDGTPLLDIKPYVPEIDQREVDKIGWLRDRISRLSASEDDGRFA